MADFPDVKIGTSDPLDLAQGLAFLGITPARAGISSTHTAETFFNFGTTLLFTRLRASAFYEILIGLVGPAAAFLMDPVHVTTESNGLLKLDFSEATSEFQAGLFAGFTFGAGAQVSVDLYLPSAWYSPWKFQWKNVFNSQVAVEFDFIELFFTLIDYLLDQAADDGLMTRDESGRKFFDSGVLSTWNFSGENRKSLFEAPRGTLQAIPSLRIPINMVDYIPLMRELNKKLHSVKGELGFGPAVTVELPVTLSLNSFTVEDGQGPGTSEVYEIAQYQEQTIIATGRDFTTVPSELTTNVSLSTGFDLDISWYIKVSACKIFDLSANIQIVDLLKLLDLTPPTLDTVHNSVSSLLEGGCVLVPGIDLTMSPAPVTAGDEVTGTVKLLGITQYAGSAPLTIVLKADPPLPGFPSSVQIAPGPPQASFHFTPPNFCVNITEPDGTEVVTSPTPTSPYYTVNVTATAQAGFETNCNTPLVVTQPLRVKNRVIEIFRLSSVGGEGPSWAPAQGSSVNSNPAAEPTDIGSSDVGLQLAWTGPPPPAAVPLTFRLYDEQGTPVPSTNGDPSINLRWAGIRSLPATVTISPEDLTGGKAELSIAFAGIGPTKKFSNRYVLSVDAGCSLGQNEFWISVWNWAGSVTVDNCAT